MAEERAWRLDGEELQLFIDALLNEGQNLIAPVMGEGGRNFRPVTSSGEVCLSPGNSRWSPKEWLLPRTEPLFIFKQSNQEAVVTDPPSDSVKPFILFGVRSCDVAGFERLDRVFLKDQVDPFYARRREAMTVIGLACTRPLPECFCTSVGGSPFASEGLDIQIIPLDESSWLLVELSLKGEALTEAYKKKWQPASEEEKKLAHKLSSRAETELKRDPVASDWPALLEESFDHPLWDKLASTCVGCSLCSYTCPTCSCFDMHDKTIGGSGVKFRCWDSCSFSLFTLHASGHNPRDNQASRYRQRVLHKFSYYPLDNDGEFGCVGCGRCLKLCPAGLDILLSVQQIAENSGSLKEGGKGGE